MLYYTKKGFPPRGASPPGGQGFPAGRNAPAARPRMRPAEPEGKEGGIMQLTGPAFFLIFLPLSVPAAVPFKRRRADMLALLSMLWYVLANLQNPIGIAHVFGLVLVVLLCACIPCRRAGTVIGVVLALASLTAARIFAEYASFSYVYPAGLTMVTLGAVSYLADRRTARHATVPEAVSYLLFFPTLTLGPILRFPEYLAALDARADSLERFSRGIHLYAFGFVERVGCAAILLRTLESIFSFGEESIPHQMVLLILPMAYFLLYFTIAGTSSMARGVSLMFGLELPNDHLPLFSAVFPDEMPRGMFLSLGRYFEAYVGDPIRRHVPGRAGRMLAGAATFVLGVFFFRLRPSLLLVALPILLFRLFRVYPESPRAFPRRLPARILWGVVSSLLCAAFAAGMILPEPLRFFSLFRTPGAGNSSFRFYYIYGSVSWTNYLLAGAAAILALLPLSRVSASAARRITGKKRIALQAAGSVLLFAAFFVTVVYFMPQFPALAERAFSHIYI